jgi:hypothetical protein
MKFENTWTGGWENSFRGLRHPMESYAKSDSKFGLTDNSDFLDKELDIAIIDYYNKLREKQKGCDLETIKLYLVKNSIIRSKETISEYALIGYNVMNLAQRMIKAGSPNDKFLRQIFVSVDITAPLYFWKELDTYKVATVANSTSTMHKLASTP